MNWPATLFILVTAYLVVFWQAAFDGVRAITGANVDLLPSLIVYTGLTGNIGQVALVSFLGGSWFDSLSVNPLGISVLPLFLIGIAIHWGRDLVLRDQAFTQIVLGLAASGTAPVLAIGLLLSIGHAP